MGFQSSRGIYVGLIKERFQQQDSVEDARETSFLGLEDGLSRSTVGLGKSGFCSDPSHPNFLCLQGLGRSLHRLESVSEFEFAFQRAIRLFPRSNGHI